MIEEDRSVPLVRLPAAIWIMMAVGTAVPATIFVWLFGLESILHPRIPVLFWLIGLTVLHEGIHAAGWKTASGLPWTAFRFGFSWRALTPYCHAKEAMPVRAYRIGSLLPLLLTGLLPFVVALMVGSADLGIASSVLIGGAAGDVWVFWSIRDLSAEALVRDHPHNAGCVVVHPD